MKQKLTFFWLLLFISGLSTLALATEETGAIKVEKSKITIEENDRHVAKVVINDDEKSFSFDSDKQVAFGDDVVVHKGETVDDLAVFGGDVEVKGLVDGDTVVFGGDLTLHPGGKVTGDAAVFGGIINEMPGGVIEGDKVEISIGSGLKKLFQAKYLVGLFGAGTSLVGAGIGAAFFFHLLYGVGKFFVLLILGICFLTFLDPQVQRLTQCIKERPMPSLAYGFLASVLFVPLGLLMAVSLIGIPLLPFLVLAYFFAAIFGVVAVCIVTGMKIKERLFKLNSTLSMFVAGLILLTLVNYIPFVGWLVCLLVIWLALGAVVLTRFGSRSIGQSPKKKDTPPTETAEKGETSHA